MNIQDKIKGLFGQIEDKSARNLREKQEAEKALKLEEARAKTNEYLKRSAQRGRHDYKPETI